MNSKQEDELLRKFIEDTPSYYDPKGEPPLVLDSEGRILSNNEIMKQCKKKGRSEDLPTTETYILNTPNSIRKEKIK